MLSVSAAIAPATMSPTTGARTAPAAFSPPWLVPPSCVRSFPLIPLAVASTDGSIVAVFFVPDIVGDVVDDRRDVRSVGTRRHSAALISLILNEVGVVVRSTSSAASDIQARLSSNSVSLSLDESDNVKIPNLYGLKIVKTVGSRSSGRRLRSHDAMSNSG